MKLEPLLTTKQVAEYLQMDVWSVRDLIHSGELVAYDVGKASTSVWRIKPSDLERYLEARRSRAPR